jgi:hypothetical protein
MATLREPIPLTRLTGASPVHIGVGLHIEIAVIAGMTGTPRSYCWPSPLSQVRIRGSRRCVARAGSPCQPTGAVCTRQTPRDLW